MGLPHYLGSSYQTLAKIQENDAMSLVTPVVSRFAVYFHQMFLYW